MKRKIITTLVILLIFTGFILTSSKQEYHLSRGEELVNITLANAAKTIKKKYDIKPCGSGAAMPGGPIQQLTLCFDTKHPYTKEQLRELLVKSSNELLNQVTENEEIKGFIKDPPFTSKNVQIIIYNHDKKGREVCDPEISTARISEAVLIYRTIDPDDSFKYKNEYKESYEEALICLSLSIL